MRPCICMPPEVVKCPLVTFSWIVLQFRKMSYISDQFIYFRLHYIFCGYINLITENN